VRGAVRYVGRKLIGSADYEHYLSLQVLPPVERLCDAIEGTERARLAECLGAQLRPTSPDTAEPALAGLDMNRYRSHTMAAPTEREFHTLDSQIPDVERFREAEPLRVVCRHCQKEAVFGGLLDDKVRAGHDSWPERS
jgi:DNA polymerase alpha subunit A